LLPRPEYSGPWNSEQEEHSEEDRSKDHAQPPVITGGKIAAVGIDQTRRIREGRYDAIKVKFAVGVRLRRQRKSRRFRLEDDLSVSRRTCAIVNRLAAEDAIFTADVGTPTVWIARYISMNGRRRILGSFNHGSMANALPQAIGAQVAFPDRQVISMSGDGGLSMLMGELLTLRQLKAPVKSSSIRMMP